MKRLLAITVSAALILTGCTSEPEFDEVSSAIQDSQDMQAEVSGETPNAEQPVEVIFPAENFEPAPVDVCRLKDQRAVIRQINNVGFPLREDVVPVEGVMNVAVIPVAFIDAGPEPGLLPFAVQQAQLMTDWYDYFSQGKLEVRSQVMDSWVSVDKASSAYDRKKGIPNTDVTQADLERNENQKSLIYEVVKQASSSIDFSNMHVLIFLFPTKSEIATSLLQREVAIETEQGPQTVMMWGTGWGPGSYHRGYEDLEWALWIHEILHSQGMALHAPGNGSMFGLGQHEYAHSRVLSGWELFLLGWLDDSQVLCLDATSTVIDDFVVHLAPLENLSKEATVLIVKTSETDALVVESRRPTGYSERFAGLKGLVAYEVDVTRDNDRSDETGIDRGNDKNFDKWAYLLAPTGTLSAESSTTGSDKFVIREGQMTEAFGLQLRYLAQGDLDAVAISRSGS